MKAAETVRLEKCGHLGDLLPKHSLKHTFLKAWICLTKTLISLIPPLTSPNDYCISKYSKGLSPNLLPFCLGVKRSLLPKPIFLGILPPKQETKRVLPAGFGQGLCLLMGHRHPRGLNFPLSSLSTDGNEIGC